MKIFLSFCFLVAFVGLMLIGCSDKSITPVETTGTNNNVVLQKETGPGAWIIRHQEEMAWGFFNEQSGIMLLLGVNDIETFCNEPTGGMDIINIKDIYLPNTDPDLRRLVALQKGKDITAMVWETDAWPDDLCGFLATELPLASGTAHLIYTDNDYYAWMYNHNNTNTFGNKANGTLSGNGHNYNLNLVYRIVWDNIEYNHFNEVFKLQLTQRGN